MLLYPHLFCCHYKADELRPESTTVVGLSGAKSIDLSRASITRLDERGFLQDLAKTQAEVTFHNFTIFP